MIAMEEIHALTQEEKLELRTAINFDLWREEQQAGEVEIPDWHREILEERERAVREGRAEYIPWETAIKEIKEDFRKRKNEIARANRG